MKKTEHTCGPHTPKEKRTRNWSSSVRGLPVGSFSLCCTRAHSQRRLEEHREAVCHDGHTRAHQNLIKQYDISTHFRLNHGPCRSQVKNKESANSTQLKNSRNGVLSVFFETLRFASSHCIHLMHIHP